MNDWIYRYMVWFWLANLAIGGLVGVWALHDTFGVFGAFAAGLVGGAGSALILSISRYIAQNQSEDDLRG